MSTNGADVAALSGGLRSDGPALGGDQDHLIQQLSEAALGRLAEPAQRMRHVPHVYIEALLDQFLGIPQKAIGHLNIGGCPSDVDDSAAQIHLGAAVSRHLAQQG